MQTGARGTVLMAHSSSCGLNTHTEIFCFLKLSVGKRKSLIAVVLSSLKNNFLN